jgi:hypothetical protein
LLALRVAHAVLDFVCFAGDLPMTETIPCPHCRHGHEDPFEVFDAGALTSMDCERCGQRFTFVIMECDHCAAEGFHSWAHEPGAAALDELTCTSCGRLYRYREQPSAKARQ